MAAKTAIKQKPDTAQQRVSRFEIVTPPRALRDLVSIRQLKPGGFNPLQNAENQLLLIEDQFAGWINEEAHNLQLKWADLQKTPKDAKAFKAFHSCVHTIRGNGAMLGCPAASELAYPLARFLERNPIIEQHIEFLALSASSISLAITQRLPVDAPQVQAVIKSMNQVVDRWTKSNLAD